MTASRVTKPAAPIGGIKQSFKTADHAGWILLNGRAVTTLSVTQRAYALATYGWGTTLPDATNRELIDGGATAAFTVAGTDTVTLTQANLPAFTATGGTLSQETVNHDHVLDPAQSPKFRRTSGGNTDPVNWGQNGAHAGSMSVDPDGPHNHAWNIPLGDATALPIENPYLSANLFAYLGS